MGNEVLRPPEFALPRHDELITGIRKASGTAGASSKRRVIADMLAQAADVAMAMPAPRSLLKKTGITGVDPGILKGRQVSIASRELCQLVAGMDQPNSIYGFTLTLGNELDDLITLTQPASLAKALFLDAAGSFLAEHYAGQMEDYLRSMLAQRGLELSARFSPGYGDWDIAHGQLELFRFLMPESIGISISASGVMSPMKSITGICIAAVHVPYRTPCELCHKKDCRYRRNAV